MLTQYPNYLYKILIIYTQGMLISFNIKMQEYMAMGNYIIYQKPSKAKLTNLG